MKYTMPKSSPTLRHLAIIMDGNGRWAEERGLPRVAGHQQGERTVVEIVNECVLKGISCLTLFAFSSGNWGRPEKEVVSLMALLLEFLASQRQRMLDDGVNLRVIGDLSRLSDEVKAALIAAQKETAAGVKLILTLALSFAGRYEIVRASRKLAQRVAAHLGYDGHLAGRSDNPDTPVAFFYSHIYGG